MQQSASETRQVARSRPFSGSILRGLIELMERGYLPDTLVRFGIRRLCARRLRDEDAGDCVSRLEAMEIFIERMNRGPVAPVPSKANEQHYGLPPEFFGLALGMRRKYSACYWPPEIRNLDEAEEAALLVTSQRAALADGQEILELGCGWGSLSVWMAEVFPRSRIVAVSNSAEQRQYIENRAAARGLTNLRVITADMNDFETDQRFDRVVSVEMFEHMRNYRELMRRIHGWLKPGGKLFFHIFCNSRFAYPFETDGEADWMARHFFTGGIMPSDDLPLHFQDDLRIERHWRWDGTHYERTANAWLANLDVNRDSALRVLERAYGPAEAARWLQRWRVFFMACAELFGYAKGQEWWVSHYRFVRRG